MLVKLTYQCSSSKDSSYRHRSIFNEHECGAHVGVAGDTKTVMRQVLEFESALVIGRREGNRGLFDAADKRGVTHVVEKADVEGARSNCV